MKDFLKPSETVTKKVSSSSSNANELALSTQNQNKIDSFTIKNDVLDAEIRWVMRCVQNHYSYKSNEGLGDFFSQMFPDSLIAKQFSCNESKSAYLCHFGLAPHFQMLLFKCFDEINHYTLLFDETLNQSNQMKQMDIHVRYWHTEENKVRTQYVTSAFIGHSTAEDMLSSFYMASEKLDLSKLLQISMDGPAVNWKFFDNLQADLNKEFGIQCVSVGSCGLHILHNSFKKGVLCTEWNLPAILSSLYWIFNDSPARREDFLSISNSDKKKLPVKLCNHRWLENCPAAERAIEIWNNVVEYVKKVENGTFSKVTCKSFAIVAEATKDHAMLIKLNVFLSIAKVVQPFLQFYQSDKPLLPFFAEDTLKLVKQCLQLFHIIKDEHYSSLSTPEKLCKFDFSDKSIFAPKHKISLGFIGDRILKEKLFKKLLSEGDALHLRIECQRFVLKIIESLMLKCPINFMLVRNVSCLDPRLMMSNSNKSKMKMKSVVSYLSKMKQICDKDGDTILMQFEEFLNEIAKDAKVEFTSYDPKSMSLDVFLSTYLKDEKYAKLWHVCKMILILSHGQASVERGFSVNKVIEVENLKENSYISRRLVYDYVNICGGAEKVKITKELRLAASSARKKYMQFLETERASKVAERNNNKRKLIEEEIDYLKKKKLCLQNDIAECEKEAEIYAEKGEAMKDISLFLKSNMLRKTIKEKGVTLAEVDHKIQIKKADLKEV